MKGIVAIVCCLLWPTWGLAQLSLSYTLTQAPVCDSNTGSVTLQASGGTPPYLYALDGSPFATGNAFAGLPAALYEAQVVDANQDTARLRFALSNPNAPTLSLLTLSPLSCAEAQDGLLEVSASGGLGTPYQYRLDGGPPQANGLFAGLSAGVHFVEVRDLGGCRRYQAFFLSQPSPVQLSLSAQQNVDCHGDSNAFVALSANGGATGGYQFSLAGAPFQASGTFTGLPAGSYSAIAEDLDGCRDTLDLLISQPPPLSLSLDSLSGIPCHGDSTGHLAVSASGGVAPYSFAPDGINFANATVFDSLPPGPYPLTVQDANGCQAQQLVALSQPAPLDLPLLSAQDPDCAGDSSGSLSLAPQGGTPPYQLSAPLGQVNGTQVSDLPGTAIPLLLTDANGCERRDTVLLSDPAPLHVQVDGLPPSCADGQDGQVQAALGGGSGPLQLAWNGNPALSADTLFNQAAGSYRLLVTDSLGCQDSAVFLLSAPAPVDLLPTLRHDTCSRQQGEIRLQASGGNGGFAFLLDGQLLPDSSRSGLGAGLYQAVVRDSLGCADTLLLSLSDQAPPVLTLDSLRPVTCAGQADGYLRVQASGGSGSYQYFWPDLGLNRDELTAVGSGSYRAVVYDGLCSDTLTLTLDAPDTLRVAIDSQRAPACSSEPTGLLSVAASGGAAPYQYGWSHDAGLDTALAQHLAGGSYAVVIEDARGCRDTLRVDLVNPLALRLTLLADDVRCAGEQNGQITALVGGGIPPYRYQWSTGDTTAQLRGLGPGQYGFTAIDQSGCVLHDTATVEVPLPLRIAVSTASATCADQPDGTAEVAVQGGTPPYQFYWSDGSRDSVVADMLPGAYLLQVQDQRQCLVDTLLQVPGPPPLRVEVVEVQPSTCTRFNGSITVQARGGQPGYRYQWDTPFPQQGPTARELQGAVPGRRFAVLVTDTTGCTATVTVDLPDRPAAVARMAATFPEDGDVLLSEAALLAENRSENAIAYRWLVNDSTIAVRGDLSYTATQPGRYEVKLVAFDPYFVCPDTVSRWVTVIPDGGLWVPTAFTPNADGRNDRWVIQGEGIQDFQLTIFDQWGKELRRIGRIDNSWDGRTVTGQQVPEGTYAYHLRVRLNNGQVKTRGGTVVLFR